MVTTRNLRARTRSAIGVGANCNWKGSPKMANYVFVYSGGKGVSVDEAERAAQYAQWGRRFAGHKRLLDRVGRQPRRRGRAREGLPSPRDRRRCRRLRSDRDVTTPW